MAATVRTLPRVTPPMMQARATQRGAVAVATIPLVDAAADAADAAGGQLTGLASQVASIESQVDTLGSRVGQLENQMPAD